MAGMVSCLLACCGLEILCWSLDKGTVLFIVVLYRRIGCLFGFGEMAGEYKIPTSLFVVSFCSF